ncbi:MAG: GC-type dockerin domain-anchored protein, partial [Planctomycetota bacterium]
GLALDAGSTAFAGPFPLGPVAFDVRYQSAASAATPTFDLVITSDCSTSGLAEITQNTAAEHIEVSASASATVGVPAGCSPADLVEPFNIIDLDDADAFIVAFLNQDPIADLVPVLGIIDLDDVDAFINAFLAGCP